ncbi:hypothetical protein AB4Y38_41590 [Paraburkholderia sp. EG285A]|uniref:hypothetical protein n=1 Tax=Paraburkholderia sp. EG285A TaxID=3237009 RepID=UPI0034D1D77B
MNTRSGLAQRVDDLLVSEVEQILACVPYSAHLISGDQELDEEYYVRHRIETIRRIRLTARIDALALARMIEEDYDSSRLWGRYTAEELNHDILFRNDLRYRGCSDETIDGIGPLQATRDLIAYLARRLDEIGSLAAVAYSLFVEWNSERVSALVVARAERRFSAQHLKGARRHLHIDRRAGHYPIILAIAQKLVVREEDERHLFTTLKDLACLFGEYFRELHDVTVGKRTGDQSGPSELCECRPDVGASHVTGDQLT